MDACLIIAVPSRMSPCLLRASTSVIWATRDLGWLKQLAKRQQGQKRYFLTRLKQSAKLYSRRGHELLLRGLLPQQEGEIVRAVGVGGSQGPHCGSSHHGQGAQRGGRAAAGAFGRGSQR